LVEQLTLNQFVAGSIPSRPTKRISKVYNLDFKNATLAANLIKNQFAINTIDTAVILGSGLGTFTEVVTVIASIPYSTLPGFPTTAVNGHKGYLTLARLKNNKLIIVFEGRFHYYEGYSPKIVTLPIVVCQMLGVKNLIVSNAAGGINKNFKPGDLMIINDHINLTGNHPLIGKNNTDYGLRFLDLSEPYSNDLIQTAVKCSDDLNFKPQQGVYLSVSGPSYETRAEIRAFATLGADAVGMSTVYEVIVANYFKIRVLGISCITNLATGIATSSHDHQSVVDVAKQSSTIFSQWVNLIVNKL
jgi:purine-nucleoside phosphorylase